MGYPQIANDNTSAQPSAAAEVDFFDTSHLASDFKTRCIRGSAVTIAGQGARFVIQTASTIILARLLTPADYGLVAMVTAVTGFMMTFKEIGRAHV